MLRKLLLTGIFLISTGLYAYAQTGTISGTVTDAQTGEALPGTNVYLTSIQKGDITDSNGGYSISDIPTGTYTLQASFVGYTPFKQQVEVTSGTQTINIKLKSGLGLNEMVVTGYGEVSRQQFTGSATTVSSDQIENVPVSSIGEVLQGQTAGANITASAGTPGSVQQIRVRGTSSINAGRDPLYVIDGVPVNSGNVIGTPSDDGNTVTSTTTGTLSRLAGLNPSDIQSVTILKDAASTAAYGARGANGVVVIKTKEGSKDSNTTYSVSAQTGFNEPAVAQPDVMNTEQFTEYTKALGYPNVRVGSPDVNTDWEEVVHNDRAAQQKYGLSARGGNDNTTFYASGSYFKQEGQVKGGKLNRVAGKLNITHDLDDHLSIKNNFTGSYVSQNSYLQGGGYFGSPVLSQYFLPPTYRAYNDDGTPNTSFPSPFNPAYIRKHDIDRFNNYRLLNNTTLTLDILDNLSFTSNFAIDYLEDEEKSYDNPVYGDGASVGGRVDQLDNRTFNYVWRNTLEYIWPINEDHRLRARAISETQRNYYRYLDGYGEGVASPGLTNLNTTAVPQGVGGATTDWAIQSFSALLNYSFQNEFYVDGSIRYEGNSRFAPNVRWGTFYSLGVSYVLTQNVITNQPWLNNLKVRASVGKTGNADIDLNQYQSTVGFSSYAGGSVIYTNTLGNRNLTWENQRQFDIGLDFTMFDRIDGSLSLYQKNGYDLLFNVPLSYTTGFEDQTQNNGKLYNKGIEVELNAQIIRTNHFAWALGGNFAYNKNKVTSLPNDPTGSPRDQVTSTRYIAEEGYPVRSWYMQEWAGVDPENGDPLWFKDLLDDDGNPTGERTTTNNYQEADKYYQGATGRPTKYGGINTRFDVFGFYASANIYYAFGNKVYDDWAGYLRADGANSAVFNQYASQSDYWKKPGDDAPNPKPVKGDPSNSSSTSTRYLYDGDFLRLKTLQIGYHIPAGFLQNVGVRSATVYFLGRNLWTYTYDDNLELDPEVGVDGFTELRAAPLKSITFGINVNF